MQKSVLFRLLLCFLALGSSSVMSQIMINEYSASNKNGLVDAFGDYPDWIELYNSSANAVNLSGFFLSDSPGNLQKYALPNASINAGQHMVLFASGRDVLSGGFYHTTFKLTQMKGEKIILSNASGLILDSLTLIPSKRNHSRGRMTDGATTWGVFPTPSPNASNISGYLRYANRPQFSMTPGFYPSTIFLVMSTPEPNVSIYYTTNGDIPTTASNLYTGSIVVPTSSVVRAIAVSSDPNVAPSFVETNSYLIGANHHDLPVISLSSPEYDDLFNGNTGEIMSTFEYFDTLRQFQFEGDGDIRGHGRDSWAYDQKGIRFYTRDDYGYANNIDYQLFESTPRQEFDVVILKAGGSDNYPGGTNQSGLMTTHLRDVFAQTLSQKHNLELDERSWYPCVIYINGQYWGIYEMRERIDADYTDYYYDQDVDSVDMLAYWGGLTVEEGSDTAWNNLYNFMMNNNLSVPANHDYVADRFELLSLIDYFILNTYTVNTDWLNWNTAWWRGRSTPGVKWRYRLWDQDNIYNLGQNYTGVGTTTYLNDPCNPTTLFPNDPNIPHTGMLSALMADTIFHDLYINRYADLINTTFNCDTLLDHLQWIVDYLSPEIPQHTARWGGSVAQWNEHLDSLRAQISGRCFVVDSLMVDCYNLTGPYDITVLVDPPGSGDVRVNTVIPATYPYVAGYYGGVTMNLYRVQSQGHPFINWTVLHHNLAPTLLSDTVSLQLSSTDTIVAHFDTTFTVGSQPLVQSGYAFRVYPTLVSNSVILEYEIPVGDLASSLTLMDLSGHVVADLSGMLDTKSRNKIEVDLSSLRLSKGMYFMNLQTNSWQKSQKLIWMGE